MPWRSERHVLSFLGGYGEDNFFQFGSHGEKRILDGLVEGLGLVDGRPDVPITSVQSGRDGDAVSRGSGKRLRHCHVKEDGAQKASPMKPVAQLACGAEDVSQLDNEITAREAICKVTGTRPQTPDAARW